MWFSRGGGKRLKERVLPATSLFPPPPASTHPVPATETWTIFNCPCATRFRMNRTSCPPWFYENISAECRTSRAAENLDDCKTKTTCSQGFTATTSSLQGPEVGSREQNGVMNRDALVNEISNRSAADVVLTSCNMPSLPAT